MAGFFSKLRGTFSSIFQLGKTGPNLKNNSNAIESRNNADTSYAIHRFDQPAGDSDGVDRQTLYGMLNANPNDPYTYTFENTANYPNTGSFAAANEVNYMRVWIPKDRIIAKLRTFITSGANGVRQIQFGIYSQSTATSITGTPNTLVASTAADTPPNTFTGIRDVSLSSAYTVATSGFYWIAMQISSNALKFAVSDIYQASYANRHEETPGTFILPSPAGATTQPKSAIAFVAAVE